MQRLILLIAAVLLFSVTAHAQDQQSNKRERARRGWNAAPDHAAPNLSRAASRPAEAVPVPQRLVPSTLKVDGADAGLDTGDDGVFSEEEMLRRISRIYNYQSEILLAEAAGDTDQVQSVLSLAMTELSTLMQYPDVVDQPRFHELYRSIITGYEKHYGPADSLTVQYGDIFQARADMFAALNDVNAPLLEDITLPDLQPVATVFPMTTNGLVESSIKYLLRSPEKHLFNWLRRSETYFPMIEKIFQEEGVPDELKYLAMIESALNPTAQSWASAAGMWQFIQATGRAYGLEVNQYVDDRMDPEKATRAAARHLKDLHVMFGGDWQLALAGYNCSPARIRRAMARAEARTGRTATFWDIYDDIPKETRGYVPMFIATALVASNPDAFNLPPVEGGPRYEYDHAPVPALMSLNAIADMSGTDVETIRALNPGLKRSTTPPSGDGIYNLRLPIGTYEQFAQAYAAAPKQERRKASSAEHVVQRGESLGQIANRYGVTVGDIKSANSLRSNTIHPKQRLVIPVEGFDDGNVPAVNLAQAQPERVQYGNRLIRPIVAATAPRATWSGDTPVVTASHTTSTSSGTRAAAGSGSSSTRTVYTVRRGDNLTELARKHGVSVGDLKQWNGLSRNTIFVGQKLKLYSDGSARVENASYTESPTKAAPAKMTTHKVRRGDTLGKIAARYGVSVSELRRLNGISGSVIRPGQNLKVGAGGESSSGANRTVYKVRRGDNLTELAKKYGVSIQDIKTWNKLKSNNIQVGQRLTIYN